MYSFVLTVACFDSCLCRNYDFGYLVRILTNAPLPDEEADFLDMHRTFFPATYDVKYLMKSVKHLKGGLQDVANALEVRT